MEDYDWRGGKKNYLRDENIFQPIGTASSPKLWDRRTIAYFRIPEQLLLCQNKPVSVTYCTYISAKRETASDFSKFKYRRARAVISYERLTYSYATIPHNYCRSWPLDIPSLKCALSDFLRGSYRCFSSCCRRSLSWRQQSRRKKEGRKEKK